MPTRWACASPWPPCQHYQPSTGLWVQGKPTYGPADRARWYDPLVILAAVVALALFWLPAVFGFGGRA